MLFACGFLLCLLSCFDQSSKSVHPTVLLHCLCGLHLIQAADGLGQNRMLKIVFSVTLAAFTAFVLYPLVHLHVLVRNVLRGGQRCV